MPAPARGSTTSVAAGWRAASSAGWWTRASSASRRIPTIFQKAIADSDDYDSAIRAASGHGSDAGDVFFELAIKDVQDAADQIRGVYDSTDHLDGFVSFELPPGMANDTDASTRAAPEFWERIGRPNIFIKIPGTAEGIPAIEESIAAGDQRQRHAAVLAGAPRRDPLGVHPRAGAAGRRRGCRSTTCTRSRASSSRGWTRPWTSSCRRTPRCAARRPSPTQSWPTSRSWRSRAVIAGRRSSSTARVCSGRCGPRPAPRTPPTRTCSMWTR